MEWTAQELKEQAQFDRISRELESVKHWLESLGESANMIQRGKHYDGPMTLRATESLAGELETIAANIRTMLQEIA